jgi:hypothetical protein
MTKLYELLQLRKRQDGDFGIEIECEGNNLAVPKNDIWNTVDDGSLRGEYPHGRAEWVFRRPHSLEDSIKELESLAKYQADNNAELNFSFRTSVHVHMNVQDLTFDQYLNTVYTYLLLENALVRYCGNERIGNRFCLRMQDAEGLSELLYGLFNKGPKMLDYFSKETAKYASINLAATKQYGSLEFRAMQGNLSVPYISTWLRALYNIREFAKQHKDPQAIHDAFVKMSPSEFMGTVLQDEYRFFSYEDEVNDIRHAFSITLELPYAYTNDEGRKEQRKLEILKREEEVRMQYEAEQMRLKQRMDRAIRAVQEDMDDVPQLRHANYAPEPVRRVAKLEKLLVGQGIIAHIGAEL